MRSERTPDSTGTKSIPDSVTAATIYGDAEIDLRLAQQLIDQGLAVEHVARELLSNALRDHA